MVMEGQHVAASTSCSFLQPWARNAILGEWESSQAGVTHGDGWVNIEVRGPRIVRDMSGLHDLDERYGQKLAKGLYNHKLNLKSTQSMLNRYSRVAL